MTTSFACDPAEMTRLKDRHDTPQPTSKQPHRHTELLTPNDTAGVTLVNPHGSNPRVTGGSVNGGEFTISWHDFEKYYGDVVIGSLW